MHRIDRGVQTLKEQGIELALWRLGALDGLVDIGVMDAIARATL